MKPSKIYFLTLCLTIFMLSCKEEKPPTETTEIKEPEVVEEKIPSQKLNETQQIASAILAAPEEVREGAKVYGFDEEGNFKTLREGTNDMICIADDPNRDGFEVVSYHKDLDPYMARGRALKAEGKAFGDRRDIREKEAAEGNLKMPTSSATLHILHGNDGYFDLDSLKVRNAKYRYVVYIPYATQASTGLSLSPNAPGHPWLMFPGKANAHIMITPPAKENK
jgi:hypothetical protein